jgi:chemotaxis protein MotB
MINYSPEVERRGGKINVKSVEGVHWKVQSVRQGLKITLHGKAAAFEPGSYELPAAYYEVLGKLRKMLAGTYNWVEIRGYTDSWPHDTLEKSHRLLGFKRAMAVYEELIKTASGEEPLDWRRFRVEGCGKIEPVDINSTADGRARNRRVEVIVTEEFYKAPEK